MDYFSFFFYLSTPLRVRPFNQLMIYILYISNDIQYTIILQESNVPQTLLSFMSQVTQVHISFVPSCTPQQPPVDVPVVPAALGFAAVLPVSGAVWDLSHRENPKNSCDSQSFPRQNVHESAANVRILL